MRANTMGSITRAKGEQVMSNLIKFPVKRNMIPTKTMFDEIIKDCKPKHAFVIVWPDDGGEVTFHSNTDDMPVMIYQVQRFIQKALNEEFE